MPQATATYTNTPHLRTLHVGRRDLVQIVSFPAAIRLDTQAHRPDALGRIAPEHCTLDMDVETALELADALNAAIVDAESETHQLSLWGAGR